MMFSRPLMVLGMGLAAALASANAVTVPRVTMEPDVRPHGHEEAGKSSWVKMDQKPDPLQEMRLTVQLDVDVARLEQVFWAVSDPKHEEYGNHRTVKEIAELLAVPDEQVRAVKTYFEGLGASVEVSPTKDVLSLRMAIKDVERALATEIRAFYHSERTTATILRAASEYSLPAHIASKVVVVGELLQFPRFRPQALNNLQGSGQWPNSCSESTCAGLVQPEVLNKRYSLGQTGSAEVNAANSMAVAEFQGQYFEPTDIASFSKACKRDVEVNSVVGGNHDTPGVEAELDIEYIRSVAPEIPLTVVYNAQYSLLDWANQITSNQSSALVHSVSYGNDEAQQSSTGYMISCNTAFMKAGTMGRSILFASGDQGVCGREGCGLGIFKKKSFKPDFPGGSPYITVVGGTDFLTDSIGDETTWPNGGGGFSNTFSIPSYQSAAVSAYKSNPDSNMPPSYLYNNTGRGYPDVAALAGQKTPYCVATGGRFAGVAGTSAACPVVAGVFAKLNGLRLKAGKSPLGFLNPFIYQNSGAFNDVTHGMNNAPPNQYGFTAVKGWDAATGWGTPNFAALSKAVEALER